MTTRPLKEKAAAPLTAARLKSLLSYDPASGEWCWLVNRTGPAGAQAGRVNAHGHRQIFIDGHPYYACRLAYLYVEGCWPPNKPHWRRLLPVLFVLALVASVFSAASFGDALLVAAVIPLLLVILVALLIPGLGSLLAAVLEKRLR